MKEASLVTNHHSQVKQVVYNDFHDTKRDSIFSTNTQSTFNTFNGVGSINDRNSMEFRDNESNFQVVEQPNEDTLENTSLANDTLVLKGKRKKLFRCSIVLKSLIVGVTVGVVALNVAFFISQDEE